MKMVIAVIRPTKLEAVQSALARIGVERMTVADSQGFARQRGQPEMYRGVEYRTQLVRKVSLEIVVNDDFLDRTVDTIRQTALSGPAGSIGDGKIFVLPVHDACRIDDSTRGPEAV